jgi:hypothetical protein
VTEVDVLIIGCGPAGIFAGLELCKKKGLRILMIDQGRDIPHRACPGRTNPEVGCTKSCHPCPLICGWGGAGAYSDGKLHISSDIGGWLSRYRSSGEFQKLSDYVDKTFLRFGAPNKLYGTDRLKVAEIQRHAVLAKMKLTPSKLRHLGTDKCFNVLIKMRNELQRAGVKIRTQTEVIRLTRDKNGITGAQTYGKEIIRSRYVIVAPGRSGSSWLKNELAVAGLKSEQNPVDLGLRLEVPAPIMQHLTDVLFEPKLTYYSRKFDDKVRVFCVCPNGEVITELNTIEGTKIVTVNGQGYSRPITKNTNFALLVSTKFTEPFYEPQKYAKNIADLANILTQGVVVQRLGDLEKGRRSTPDRIRNSIVMPTLRAAKPGDLSFVLPYRLLTDILEMLEAMEKIAPGVYSEGNLLYGLEAKFYSSKPELTNDFETKIPNLYAVGDGAGISRGLFQAAISGVVAAHAILERLT